MRVRAWRPTTRTGHSCARSSTTRHWPGGRRSPPNWSASTSRRCSRSPFPANTGRWGCWSYRRTAGALSVGAHQSAQLCAAALQRTLESNWADHLRHSTSEEAAIEAAALSGSGAANGDPFTRQQVYVAAGMIAVQLEISTSAALDRLRAYAFSHHASVTAVAADVVARRLSFRHLDDSSVDP
ncbi:MAG: hypothetical protein WBB57_26255 [Mycobacterium sp.]